MKGKKGEFDALEKLPSRTKDKMQPLVEVSDIQWDYKAGRASKTPDAHTEKFADKLVKAWGIESPFFLDFPASLQEAKCADGQTLASKVLQEVRDKGLQAIPVTGVRRVAAYRADIRDAVATDDRGICLRLEAEDIGNPGIQSILDAALKEFGVAASATDLVLDFKEILPSQEGFTLLALQQVMANLPHASEWRSVTFVASSFPKDLAGIKANTLEKIPRTEWIIWKKMQGDKTRFPLAIGYGDYAIQHPILSEIDPRIMQVSANIRYALEDEWLILKGRSIKTTGAGQYRDPLSKKLVSMKEFAGAAYSAGDAYIADCASGKGGPGNATTWRFVGVNHHLHVAADQSSKLRP